MLRQIASALTLLFLTFQPASAVTLTVDITSISGPGDSTNFGFYSTTGASGTFSNNNSFPEPLLSFSFPGSPFNVSGVTAGFGSNAYAYDPSTGILDVSGTLAGLTGDFDFPGGRSFSYVIQAATGLSFSGNADLAGIYDTMTGVSGTVSAFFFPDPNDFDTAFAQTMTFSSETSEIPLPAGGLLLLSGLGLLALRRRS
ncbi:MAG: LPXTG cell wall anchor domain-containing protein [Paracoccaceae bacterium]